MTTLQIILLIVGSVFGGIIIGSAIVIWLLNVGTKAVLRK